jgi:predicted kinase
MTDQQYIDAYLTTIKTTTGNTKAVFLVGMVGLVGVGKSTFSQALSARLGLYVASNDTIRRWLNEQGVPGVSPRQDLVQKIAEASTKYLFTHSISHILDADLVEYYDTARQYADRYGARFFLLHLVAPEQTILSRIEERTAKGDKTGSLAGIEEYKIRHDFHQKLGLPPDISLTISTEGSMEEGVERAMTFLKDQGAIDSRI